MKLAEALSDKRMDSRVIDRLLAEGKVTKAEYDKYLSELPDESGNYEVVDANLENKEVEASPEA